MWIEVKKQKNIDTFVLINSDKVSYFFIDESQNLKARIGDEFFIVAEDVADPESLRKQIMIETEEKGFHANPNPSEYLELRRALSNNDCFLSFRKYNYKR